MKSKYQNQVATTIYHTFFSLDLMRECKDQGFAKHLSIAYEYVKFICHNSPFETLEVHDTSIKGVQSSIKYFIQKLGSKDKYLNANTQKADEGKTKLSNLESRVVKLEKKQLLLTESIDGFDNGTFVAANNSTLTSLYDCGSFDLKESVHILNGHRAKNITETINISKGKGTVYLYFESIHIWLPVITPISFYAMFLNNTIIYTN